MPLQADQLPLEIWLHIFTHLEGHDLVRAFSCLNAFFDSLLRSPHLRFYIRIKQNEANERLPDSTWSYINRENISSLTVGRRKANCLIQFLRWNAQYLTRLSSLAVYLRKSNSYRNIQFLIFALEQLPSLKRLRIKYSARFDPNTNDLEPLMSNLFSTRFNIQTYSFIIHSSNFKTNTSAWSMNPFVRYLHMKNISRYHLSAILPFTPQLYSLRGTTDWSNILSGTIVILPDLQKFDLRFPILSFTQLQSLRQIAPNLQFLRLEGNLNRTDENFFQENLLQEFLNNIKYFHMHLKAVTSYNSTKIILKEQIQKCNWFNYEETDDTMTISIK